MQHRVLSIVELVQIVTMHACELNVTVHEKKLGRIPLELLLGGALSGDTTALLPAALTMDARETALAMDARETATHKSRNY